MALFEKYTGNAMLNNALMTIEVLANLSEPSEITIDLLRNLFEEVEVVNHNKRFKSYTMLFSRNGPLLNDKTNGEKIYRTLFYNILKADQSKGNRICEISGIRFQHSFESIYKDTLKELGYSDKEIAKRDTTIGRTWFPLIGGLGSDAQALQQAKFATEIHPICIAIMQFLPFSSVLYKGGVMLVDSTNFEFAKDLVADNVKEVKNKISATSKSKPIENIKDNHKGDFVTRAVSLLADKRDFYKDVYSDLNFWSFSNSGTGASCFIDRLPNQLLQKLMAFQKDSYTQNELKSILKNPAIAEKFLEALDANENWFGLYPYKYGSGKKAVEFEGVSFSFLEKYLQLIGGKFNIPLIKYLAYLIDKYKSKPLEKLIEKKDGYKHPEFSTEIYRLMVLSVEKEELNPLHYIELLDDTMPVSNYFSRYNKLIHYYCYKNETSEKQPSLDEQIYQTKVYAVLRWINAIIHNDEKCEIIKKRLLDKQNYEQVSFKEVLLRQFRKLGISLEEIMEVFYNGNTYFVRKGLNQLLRVYYSWNNHEKNTVYQPLSTNLKLPNFVDAIRLFAGDFYEYYTEKYKNQETQILPVQKYQKQVEAISLTPISGFLFWIRDVLENMGDFDKKYQEKWSDEAFLYDDEGNFATQWIRFILKYQLLKQ